MQEKLQERLAQESAAAVDRARPLAGDRAPRDGRSAERVAADRKASQVRCSAAGKTHSEKGFLESTALCQLCACERAAQYCMSGAWPLL